MTAEVTKSSVTTSQYNSHINYNMGGGRGEEGRTNQTASGDIVEADSFQHFKSKLKSYLNI